MARRLNTRWDMAQVIQSGAGQRIGAMLMTGLSTFIVLVPILFARSGAYPVCPRHRRRRHAAHRRAHGGRGALGTADGVGGIPPIFMFWCGRGLMPGPRHLHGTITIAGITDSQNTVLSPRLAGACTDAGRAVAGKWLGQ